MGVLLTLDVLQASLNTFSRPGTWHATIIYGQHIRERTTAVQGIMETDKGTTEIVWNENKRLESHQNEEAKHLVIQVFCNEEYDCAAMVPLKENTPESQWYELKTSSGSSCGYVKLAYTWALQRPQIRSTGDLTYVSASYHSGRPMSNHVPPQHNMHYSNNDSRMVAAPRSDANGVYPQGDPYNSHGVNPITYGAEYGYQGTNNPHQQHGSAYGSGPPTYPPQPSNNGQYTAYGGGAAYGASYPPPANNQHAQGNQYGSSYQNRAAPDYGSSSNGRFAPGRYEYGNGYGRPS